jgi:hypothetical protein
MICRRQRFQTARPARRRIRPSLVVHAVARHRLISLVAGGVRYLGSLARLAPALSAVLGAGRRSPPPTGRACLLNIDRGE